MRTIGPEGGTVASVDGQATLGVPEGALTTHVSITVGEVDDGRFAGEDLYVPGTAYELKPVGLAFLKPAHLSITYDPQNLPEGVVEQRLRIRERILNGWQETQQNQVRVQDRVVEGAIEHFSIYALIAQDEATIPVASVAIQPNVLNLPLAASDELVAVAMGDDGYSVDRTFEWTSSNTNVVSVTSNGVVTGNAGGTAIVTAEVEGKQGSATVTVPVASIVVDPIGSDPLEAGGTLQLIARAYDGTGAPMVAVFTWTTSNAAVATVDEAGLVTGVASGDATIKAAVGATSGEVAVRVVGEVETLGNNLSWPVVFAEGIGITGSPVATDPGVRPSTAETDPLAELTAIPVTNPTAAFWWSANVPDLVTGYYLQATASAWRAQIVDGTALPTYDASADWGDNLTGTGNLGVDHPIRVEVALSTTDGVSLLGYNMPYVANPSSPEEVQGTDGTTSALTPLIYTVGPTLTIERLDGPGGSVIATVSSATYKAEVNVGGRLIYGAQFRPTVAGTYRLRFILAGEANVDITESNAVVVSPNETAIEVQVTP